MNRGSGDSLSYHQYLSSMFLQRSIQVLLVFGAQALHAEPDGRSAFLQKHCVECHDAEARQPTYSKTAH
jgi:cytochrome c551/c552